jgi:hypothetical protein
MKRSSKEWKEATNEAMKKDRRQQVSEHQRTCWIQLPAGQQDERALRTSYERLGTRLVEFWDVTTHQSQAEPTTRESAHFAKLLGVITTQSKWVIPW